MGWNADDDSELHSLRGPTDRSALIEFRNTVNEEEPLAEAELDDFFDTDELNIFMEDGIGNATGGRFDVDWTTEDDYSIHYTDALGNNLRWGHHNQDFPEPDGDAHFHPPPDASSDPADVEESCIEVREVELVARAIMNLWHEAYKEGTVMNTNNLENPL